VTNSSVRGLWLAVILLTAVLTGSAGGLLAWLGGANPPKAILTGASVFSGTVLLSLTMLLFAMGGGD
jgi:hypothetical protein